MKINKNSNKNNSSNILESEVTLEAYSNMNIN